MLSAFGANSEKYTDHLKREETLKIVYPSGTVDSKVVVTACYPKGMWVDIGGASIHRAGPTLPPFVEEGWGSSRCMPCLPAPLLAGLGNTGMKHILSTRSDSPGAAKIGHGRDAIDPPLLNQSMAAWFDAVQSCRRASGEPTPEFTLADFKAIIAFMIGQGPDSIP